MSSPPTRHLLFSAVLAGVTLFLWGFVSHVILGWQDDVWNQFTDEAAVAEAMSANSPVRGVYHVPYAEEDIRGDRLRAFVNVLPAGAGPSMGWQVGSGLVVHLLSALLVVGLWSRTRERSFRSTVGFFAAIGFTIAFVGHGFYWAWFGFPSDYVAVTILDSVVGWSLAGLPVAALGAREPASPPASTIVGDREAIGS